MKSTSPSVHLLAKLKTKSGKDGRVWYGHAITYAKVASWFEEGRPSARTVRRWMDELKRSGWVIVTKVRMNQGIKVRILDSPAPRQISMFSEPVEMKNPRAKGCAKTGGKLVEAVSTSPAKVGRTCGQNWPQKEVSLSFYSKDQKPAAPAAAISSGANLANQTPRADDDRIAGNELRAELDKFFGTRRFLPMPRAPSSRELEQRRQKLLRDLERSQKARAG